MNLKSVEPHLHSSQTQQESVAIFTIQAGFVIITQIKSMNKFSCIIFCCIAAAASMLMTDVGDDYTNVLVTTIK